MIITEAARKKVNQVLNGEGFLGILLEGGGCSGYQIKLSPTGDIPKDAKMISDTIYSDEISLDLLGDAEMDWMITRSNHHSNSRRQRVHILVGAVQVFN